MAKIVEGREDGAGHSFAIAISRFNKPVSDGLLEGALHTLARSGVRDEDITVYWVPGAFELPMACRWLAETSRFEGVIALGAVIRGETHHYEHICHQATRGILDAGAATDVPIALGVLTCETAELARTRSAPGPDNKGGEAAQAALEMAALRRVIDAG
ncbi:MAG: 6,7-dimethyl-8-ribityllumazine synthase [Planctomycetota bacterium]|jgi:6,7-dimethyl-8-ribityllumazine synthase|nr:6,7-dimethyl-8-ribityllumazine synthase [Planctomycetota bacterium]